MMKRTGNGKTLENTPEKGRKSVILVKPFFTFLGGNLPQFPLCSGKLPRYLSIGCPVNGKPGALRRAAGAITSRNPIIQCFWCALICLHLAKPLIGIIGASRQTSNRAVAL